MKISNYFTHKETTVSATGKELGIKNIVPVFLEGTVIYSASRLDAIRQLLGVPMTVLSWYRSEELNKAVGGATNSQHKKGEAIDFTIKVGIEKAFKIIQDSGLSFDQLIFYPRKNFIHISFLRDINKERKQVIVKK